MSTPGRPKGEYRSAQHEGIPMSMPTIRQVRAFTLRGGGGDYHDQADGHWIDGQISTPMSRWPEYRMTRKSFGIDVLGTLVVEIEASDGTVGFGVTTAGEIGAFIVEKHLARFVEGKAVDQIETIWEQMYGATLFYGRKGVVLNAISGVDLALWDLLAKVRKEPVHALLGGPVRDELVFYATGVRPDLAKQMGFIGGKMPLVHGPAEGEAGLRANLEQLAAMRSKVGPDFWLMFDCWMSLDLDYATRLAAGAPRARPQVARGVPAARRLLGLCRAAQGRADGACMVTTGEHEATRWGFRMLLEMGCADILQPDVGWCGGLTEMVKISAMADAKSVLVVPHGSSVYSYHFVVTRHNSPFAEFLMMAPAADQVVPMFTPLLLDEPVPVGRAAEGERARRPGFRSAVEPRLQVAPSASPLTPCHDLARHPAPFARRPARQGRARHRRELGHRRRGRARVRLLGHAGGAALPLEARRGARRWSRASAPAAARPRPSPPRPRTAPAWRGSPSTPASASAGSTCSSTTPAASSAGCRSPRPTTRSSTRCSSRTPAR